MFAHPGFDVVAAKADAQRFSAVARLTYLPKVTGDRDIDAAVAPF
jgi:hypothetical protein